MVLTTRFLLGFAVLFSVGSANAQANQEEQAMAEYLGLLSQIAPSARDGAEAFRTAYRRSCGREIRTSELRRAVAEGTGDPVLMQMMRASHERNDPELIRLAGLIQCRR